VTFPFSKQSRWSVRFIEIQIQTMRMKSLMNPLPMAVVAMTSVVALGVAPAVVLAAARVDGTRKARDTARSKAHRYRHSLPTDLICGPYGALRRTIEW
jgi:hypothetical protein